MESARSAAGLLHKILRTHVHCDGSLVLTRSIYLWADNSLSMRVKVIERLKQSTRNAIWFITNRHLGRGVRGPSLGAFCVKDKDHDSISISPYCQLINAAPRCR